MPRTYIATLAALLLAGLVLTDSAAAVDKDFINPASGFYNTTTNWSPTGIPAAGDPIFFNQHLAGYNVWFLDDRTALRCRIADDELTFALFSNVLTLTSTSSPSLSLGGSTVIPPTGANVAVLTITGGTVQAKTVDIGGGQFGSGTLKVIGNSLLNAAGGVKVGSLGSGVLEVSGGSDVTGPYLFVGNGASGTGNATVTGSGSRCDVNLVSVGLNTTGVLDITAGGVVTSALNANIGVIAGETGTINVSGSAPLTQFICNDDLVVGVDGIGNLNISGGGLVRCEDPIAVGANSPATGHVSVSGNGFWDVNDFLTIGNQGSATLSISAAGRVACELNAMIAAGAAGDGAVAVTDPGSMWNSAASVYIGGSSSAAGGPGSLTVSNGASMTLSSTANNAIVVWPTGTFNFHGGVIMLDELRLNGPFNWTAGELLFQAPLTIQTLSALAPSGSFTITGAGKRLTTPSLLVGDLAPGTLTANGEIDLETSNYLGVGEYVTGTLSLSSGADLLTIGGVNLGHNANGNGSVSLSGAGTTWETEHFAVAGPPVVIGNLGDGAVSLLNGATFDVFGQTSPILAAELNSTGSITIDGTGSRMSIQSTDIGVGIRGQGTINIANGGALNTPAAHLGVNDGNGHVTITGNGSLFNSGYTDVGRFGDGFLTVSGGADAVTGDCFIALSVGSSGSVSLDGAGTTLSALGVFDQLIVGGGGVGTMTVQNGATATTGQLIIGDGTGSDGDLLVSGPGSQVSAAEEVLVGFLGNASLRLDNGGAVVSPIIEIAPGNSAGGRGTLSANVTNDGTVAPGASAGILNINGPYSQAAGGLLVIEIGGATPGTQHDRLAVTGTASLDGTLDLALISGFTPSSGQQFTILTAASVIGQFDTVNASFDATLVYNPTSVVVVAGSAPACPADLDHNGTVNGLDLAVLLGTWTGALTYSPCPPFRPADFNHDCKVNGLDLATLLSAWGVCH